MFKLSKQYKHILGEMAKADFLDENAYFTSFSDSIFTYLLECEIGQVNFEFSGQNLLLLYEVKVEDLLNQESITYFSCSITYRGLMNTSLINEYSMNIELSLN